MATLDDLKTALADRYDLQRELGQGCMATGLYRAGGGINRGCEGSGGS